MFKSQFTSIEVKTMLLEQDEQFKYISFFVNWSLKEAFVKAIGLGLGYDLSDVSWSAFQRFFPYCFSLNIDTVLYLIFLQRSHGDIRVSSDFHQGRIAWRLEIWVLECGCLSRDGHSNRSSCGLHPFIRFTSMEYWCEGYLKKGRRRLDKWSLLN